MYTVQTIENPSTPAHRDCARSTYDLELEDGPFRVGPMTDRPGDDLAQRYGYANVGSLSRSLPGNSDILDVGAGLSNLGHLVTSRRPDVRWTNFDIRYVPGLLDSATEEKLDTLQATAPDNLQYVAGNVLELPQEITAKRYARIFSYYMLHHVIGNGREMGFHAVRNILHIGEPGGKLSVGPIGLMLYSTLTVAVPEDPDAIDALAVQVADTVRDAG
jgi:hypothetical protein